MQKIFLSVIILTSLLFTSCFQDEDIIEDVIIETSVNEALINSNVTLKAYTKSGKDVTNVSRFIVDNVEQSSNIITSNTAKTINVQSKFNDRVSTAKQVRFSNAVSGFVKRALVEDYTGTWCGNCPRVTYALEQIKLNHTDKVVEVAIHRGTPQQNEPYVFDATVLEQLVSVNGYPSARINRNIIWSAQQQNNLQQVILQTQGDVVKMGVAMDNTVSNGVVNLKLKVGYVESFSNLKIVVYVLENGLVYPQENYTPFYGGLPIISNFVHNHTLRSCTTNLLGDAIPNLTTSSGLLNTFTKDFTFPVPSNVTNVANIEFVAFVLNSTGTAINSRKASHNTVQILEQL